MAIGAGSSAALDRARIRHAADLDECHSARSAAGARSSPRAVASPDHAAGHQRAADQRQVVARGRARRAASSGLPTPLSATRGTPRGSRPASFEPTRHDLQRHQIAAVHPTSSGGDPRGMRLDQLGGERDIRLIEGLEQHEQPEVPRRLQQRIELPAASMRRMTSTPPAPAARASSTW
jgi:hypothetical protein